ncbi:MAG: hypothetical protein RBS57_01605 [Desulforhabdus sp.]|jgi:hypothetical protein|nr:hypothetical protein [Desulforhabdus sp.]
MSTGKLTFWLAAGCMIALIHAFSPTCSADSLQGVSISRPTFQARSEWPLPVSSTIVFPGALPLVNENATKVKIPILGEIDARDYSLLSLAVLLGLIDGFNPCAMWALVYLISIVVSLSDKRKIWIIVGTFVLSSGVLYFLFMSAWLNAFLFLGYMRPITLIIGLIAIYVGMGSFIELIRTRGAVACNVVDERSKEKTLSKMKKIVLAPVTFTSVISIIVLAFVINSMEFVCSCAIPAVFTHVLALSKLSTLEHYSYILLYVFFFMLDDLIIFGSAAFAFNTIIGNKYVAYCKLIGGIILTVLGFMLVFMPHILLMG